MSNEELIAEAREPQSDPMVAVYLEAQRWGYELSTTEAAHIAEAALEAQSAPLVADSREALVAGLMSDECFEHSPDADGWVFSPRLAVTHLLASGTVSLAADRDRTVAERAWDEGERHESEFLDRVGQFCPYKNCNPYRESEGK